MSTQMRVTKRCAVCGEASEQIILTSTNRFGAPDLDLRPPEMMRSTMRWWIQKCPNCSYVSGDIENATSARVKWMKAIELVLSDKMKFKSSLAEDFYKHYLISHRDMRVKDAFYAILHAAWACDDCLDGENAVFCRKLAIEELDRFVEPPRMNENLLIVRADLLRRSGEFDRLIREYQSKSFSTDLLNAAIRFQLERARACDSACYTFDSVEK